MPHDISGINSNKPSHMGDRSVTQVKKSDDTTKSTKNNTDAVTTGDKVTLTDTAAKLKALEMDLANQPSVDHTKVKDMQNVIQSGSYKMDPERIADKMINFESAFNDS